MQRVNYPFIFGLISWNNRELYRWSFKGDDLTISIPHMHHGPSIPIILMIFYFIFFPKNKEEYIIWLGRNQAEIVNFGSFPIFNPSLFDTYSTHPFSTTHLNLSKPNRIRPFAISNCNPWAFSFFFPRKFCQLVRTSTYATSASIIW